MEERKFKGMRRFYVRKKTRYFSQQLQQVSTGEDEEVQGKRRKKTTGREKRDISGMKRRLHAPKKYRRESVAVNRKTRGKKERLYSASIMNATVAAARERLLNPAETRSPGALKATGGTKEREPKNEGKRFPAPQERNTEKTGGTRFPACGTLNKKRTPQGDC